jgi:transcriptional regulator with XRE-family HTH domain
VVAGLPQGRADEMQKNAIASPLLVCYDGDNNKRGHRRKEQIICGIRQKLKATRQARGWSIENAAEAVGVDVSTYHRWELGTQDPHPGHIQDLERAFGMCAEELGLGEVQVSVFRDGRITIEGSERLRKGFLQELDRGMRKLGVILTWEEPGRHR